MIFSGAGAEFLFSFQSAGLRCDVRSADINRPHLGHLLEAELCCQHCSVPPRICQTRWCSPCDIVQCTHFLLPVSTEDTAELQTGRAPVLPRSHLYLIGMWVFALPSPESHPSFLITVHANLVVISPTLTIRSLSLGSFYRVHNLLISAEHNETSSDTSRPVITELSLNFLKQNKMFQICSYMTQFKVY